MGHSCLGKYKDPKNCDKCIDLKKCKELGANTIVQEENSEPKKSRGRKVVSEEKVTPEVNLDEFFPNDSK